MTHPETETKDYSRKWQAMAAVGTGVFLATLDGSIINVSLPTLVRDLNTDFAVVQWVVLAYLLTITSTMAGIGRLADMVGRKTIYMAGFIIFTLGSALCGFSPTVHWLIGFRVLQAVGAAMTMALGAAIVTEAFPPAEGERPWASSGEWCPWALSWGRPWGESFWGFSPGTGSFSSTCPWASWESSWSSGISRILNPPAAAGSTSRGPWPCFSASSPCSWA
nr:MFS transporter [Desulfobacula sp.]